VNRTAEPNTAAGAMAGSSAAERPYQPANAVVATRQKVPGAPQRRDTTGALSQARERAVQDPGLKDYVCAATFSRFSADVERLEGETKQSIE